MTKQFTREDWALFVTSVISEQPELVSTTVAAMQEGVLANRERQLDRIGDLSMGLHEALRTERRAKTRKHGVIIQAIEASNIHPTAWSKEAIAKEQP
jgi:hypothetical protein